MYLDGLFNKCGQTVQNIRFVVRQDRLELPDELRILRVDYLLSLLWVCRERGLRSGPRRVLVAVVVSVMMVVVRRVKWVVRSRSAWAVMRLWVMAVSMR